MRKTREILRLKHYTQRPPEEARRVLPDMAKVHKELKGKHRNKGTRLQLLWEEYRAEHPEGYGYTQFCEYYRRFASRLEPLLRQLYRAGEKLFVDWAGQTVPITPRGFHFFCHM